MLNMLLKLISKKYTKNYKEVPLMLVMFDLNHFTELGSKGSCVVRFHPNLKDDQHVREVMGDVIDYIRDNYDMEKLSKLENVSKYKK